MLFTESIFLFYFLPFSLLAHRIAIGFNKGSQYGTVARLVLFLLTLVFYGFKQPWWLLPFVVCIGFDFLWASLLSRTDHPSKRKAICALSIVQNLSLLAFFKYSEFIRRIIGYCLPSCLPYVPELQLAGAPVGLPAGISFYTFESLSFVIDVYRRHLTPPKNPMEFFGFIGMFPRFIAGPIVRYREIAVQFKRYGGMEIEAGLFLFTIGLFTKVCFADSFEVFTGYAFDRPYAETLTFPSALMGVFAYTMQIYFDFSGYSLMAIGLGRCFGFQFPVNFNRPYTATSLQDFWRRWHISLSTWLRDYLYISLGGNRRGKLRAYFNLLITMVLGGIWHGAGVGFLFWGIWHGLALCLERALGAERAQAHFFRRLINFVIIMVGWVFFRAPGHLVMFKIFRALLNPFHGTFAFNPTALVIHPLAVFFCVVGCLYAFWIEPRLPALETAVLPNLSIRQTVTAIAAFSVALVVLFSARSVPFLYFQF